MNSKMTTNSQLSTTEPKKKKTHKQTKQKKRIGTESQNWRSHGYQWGRKEGRTGEKVRVKP